jgi:hypothetical protein
MITAFLFRFKPFSRLAEQVAAVNPPRDDRFATIWTHA